MTTIPKPASLADGLTAIYDAWNRLIEVKDGQIVIARYDYDGLNRRIKSHIDSGAPSNPTGIDSYIHYYHNSAWQILETRQTDTQSAASETLQPKHQYVWSRRYIDAAILRDENTGANGLCDDRRLYYLNDANFNVTALLDAAGDALERYVYSPYGVVTIYDATWTNTRSESTYGNVTLYTGRELDGETGLYYYRNRYYGAQLGRFVSRDPIGYEAGDGSLYRYLENSPLNGIDPTGGYTVTCPLRQGGTVTPVNVPLDAPVASAGGFQISGGSTSPAPLRPVPSHVLHCRQARRVLAVYECNCGGRICPIFGETRQEREGTKDLGPQWVRVIELAAGAGPATGIIGISWGTIHPDDRAWANNRCTTADFGTWSAPLDATMTFDCPT